MNEFAHARTAVTTYLRSQLVGPSGGPEEVIKDPPNRRYLMGILFPRQSSYEALTAAEGEVPDVPEANEENEEALFADDAVRMANQFLPSSQGVSFFTDADAVMVRVQGARYVTLEGADALEAQAESANPEEELGVVASAAGTSRRVWKRAPLASTVETFHRSGKRSALEARAELHVIWRPIPGGSLVTVTVVNRAETGEDRDPSREWDDLILQVGFEVTVDSPGQILEYPSLARASGDLEEAELRLQYSESKTFAVGHGCSATWDDGQPLRRVRSEVMPTSEVPRVRSGGSADSQVLRLDYLARAESSELVQPLSAFVDEYASWVDDQRRLAETMGGDAREAAQRIVDRLSGVVARMRGGVKHLAEDRNSAEAFRYANEAMSWQMRHSAADLAGSRRQRSADIVWPIEPGANRWRPFQLGFFLTCVASVADPSHDERATADLIWFPTGGGKTEAYLLVALFEIFRRRLAQGQAGTGTAVISRYTLSLLTTQQFQRAATTICAAEGLRRARPTRLGTEPISVGLWVGMATTANRYRQAREQLDELRDAEEPDDRFLLERCPWCGTEILPRTRSEDLGDYGVTATDKSFRFFCPRSSCPFHDALPVHVIDDDLYDHPPSFLLGTVDKFAGLAWEPRAGAFFGSQGTIPPTLIIQDELHLLTGPLGTIMGLYESAIDRLCMHEDHGPKVIASTATIRRADQQVRGLFRRDTTLFPPAGLSSHDSFYARTDLDSPGRLYVGVMAQGHTSDTAVVHTCSALLQAPVATDLEGPVRDAYWTLVAYHSSLRELGRTVTMALDDVPGRLKALIGAGRRDYEVEELTSNVPRSLQPRLLERLNLGYEQKDHIGFLATTNMLSVGVDVPRLGLMMVNGQPKATAEYIQATSRVGRERAAGLIVTLFRSTKPRDRSHYESFGPYHAALYRFVEPTSVTPFAPPARDRALHAALVILVRHALGLAADSAAGEIETHSDAVTRLIEDLVKVVELTEPREAAAARRDLEDFLDSWVDSARSAANEGKALYYQPAGRGHHNLLKNFNQRGQGRETLRSMRNVDQACLVEVLGARKS